MKGETKDLQGGDERQLHERRDERHAYKEETRNTSTKRRGERRGDSTRETPSSQ